MPKSPIRHLLILDFEATCEQRGAKSDFDLARQEVIEFPVAWLALEDRRIHDTFSTFVRPTEQPRLTEFCTELTSIRNEDVESAPTIAEVTASFNAWLSAHGLGYHNALVVTCGDWDLLSMWPKQMGLVPGMTSPRLFSRWCNIKTSFAQRMHTKPKGMMAMLRRLGLKHEGHHHRGIDDVLNLTRIAIELLNRGHDIEATFTNADATREHRRYLGLATKAENRRSELRRQLQALPAAAPVEAGERLHRAIDGLAIEIERARTMAQVFAGA